MEGYIDIHCHILPCVDDGSNSMEQTINMIKIAEASGTRIMIVTPHYHEGRSTCTYDEILDKLKEIVDNTEFLEHNVKLYPGCEIYYTHDSLKALKEHRIPSLANSKYVLLEFSPQIEFRNMKSALQEYIFEGYSPIIAHIERYKNVACKLELVEELVDMGSYVQVNARSVEGQNGYDSKKVSRKLLKHNMVHFIGSDSHEDQKRSPDIRKCIKYIKRKFGGDYLYELMIDNPGRIIADQYI